ncbi:MAG: hypothetical protein AAFV53_13965 [Myxococcota bacterium]
MRWATLFLVGCSAGDVQQSSTSVDGGRYLSFAPKDAGEQVLIYFHPYNSTPEAARERSWMQEGLREYGVVGVFPEGVNRTWAHTGSPSDARDELAFFDAVVSDVRERWSPETVFVSGFSQGGSMAWDVACYRGDEIDAVFPVSGAFWEPLPETCPTAVRLRHTHGTSDQTVPMSGRPIGSSRQGDVVAGMAVWQRTNGCAQDAVEEVIEGPSTCQVWSCASGREVQLCLHNGGHRPPEGWLDRNLGWAIGR